MAVIKKPASSTARFDETGNFYFDVYNTAAMLYPNKSAVFYHKAKLVPGLKHFHRFYFGWVVCLIALVAPVAHLVEIKND
jgi:hypothetical protein